MPLRIPLPRAAAALSPERREALLWICLLIAVNQLGFGMIIPAVPLYATQFGVTETAVGLSIALYGLARFVVNVPAGRLADARGRKTLLAVGAIATAAGNAICAVAPDFTVFLVGRFVSGAGAAMVLTGGMTVVADISAVSNRGRLMALYQGVFQFSVGFGPVVGGVLATRYDLATPFAANAALSLGTAAIALLRVPETGSERAAERAGAPRMGMAAQLRLLRAIPGFALVGLVSFSLFFARTGALFNVVPLDARERIGLSPEQIGLALGSISVVGLLLAYPAGMLTDRFGRKAVIVPATLLYAGAMALFGLVDSWPGFLLASAVLASSSGIGGAAPGAYAADIAPPGMMASALGAYRTIADTGYVIGPLMLGAINDVAGANVAYAVAGALVAGSGLLFGLRAPETRERPGTATSGGLPKP